jgi:hypothetical protein
MRRRDCWQVCLLLLCCFWLPVESGFKSYCDLRDEPIVTFEYQDGHYVRHVRNTSGLNVTTNNVNVSSATDDFYIDFGQPTDNNNNMPTNEQLPLSVEAKKCVCWDSGRNSNRSMQYYCAMNNIQITHCGIPRATTTTTTHGLDTDDDDFPGCVNVKPATSFVRGVWPLLVISYLFLVCFLFLTMSGREALSYGLGLAVPQWNTWRVEHMIHHRPASANGLILRYFRSEVRRIRTESFDMEQSGIWGLWGTYVR